MSRLNRPPAFIELGVRCELDEDDGANGSLSFGLVEFAQTADGDRVPLVTDRGWGRQLNRASLQRGANAWDHTTVDSIVSTIRTMLLPDDLDAEDDHHWTWLAHLCAEKGVHTSRDELRQLPYTVEFGPRLADRLGTVSTTIDWNA